MLNWIWLAFLLVAVLVGGFSGRLPEMTKGAFETAEVAVMKIALPLIGIWAIWLGIMRLAEQSGLVQKLARALRPVMRRLFPEVPPEHPAMGAMVLNMAANMLGLGNAATPLGLRAMAHLERLNPHPGTATSAMCTFLALNTASIQLIPTTAIGILAVAKAANPTGVLSNPTAIVPAAFLATVCAACSGVLAAKVLERLPAFRLREAPVESARSERATEAAGTEPIAAESVTAPPFTARGRLVFTLFLAAIMAMGVIIAFPEWVNSLVLVLDNLLGKLAALLAKAHLSFHPQPLGWSAPLLPQIAEKGPLMRLLTALSILAVPFLLSVFPLYAALRGVKVYEQFVEGAREAFGTAQRVIPFLVAMLVSISLLRNAGVIDLMTRTLQPALNFLRFPADLLPLVLMRPLSGSATQGIFVELVNRLGPDTLVSRMAATIYGSTETTFYVIAVYFGAVAVRQTRHAVAVGLIADTVAVIASVAICRMMFPG